MTLIAPHPAQESNTDAEALFREARQRRRRRRMLLLGVLLLLLAGTGLGYGLSQRQPPTDETPASPYEGARALPVKHPVRHDCLRR